MKTYFFLKAISTMLMFILIIGSFMSIQPLSVSALSPGIKAYLLENQVEAFSWPLDTLLTLTITGSGEPYTAQGTATPDPWGAGGFRFDLGGAFNLEPGQIVTISDQTTTKVLTVMDLYVASFNPAEKTITGHSDPNAPVQVNIWAPGNPYREVTADGAGSWQVAFDASYDPFPSSTSGTASSSDEDGDITQYQINMGSLTTMDPLVGADNIFYVNCARARPYILRIDDPATGAGVDYETSQPCTQANWGTYVNFILVDFNLKAGDLITVASEHPIRSLVVTPKGSLSFDTQNDILSGVNRPNTELSIRTPAAQRAIKTGPDGKWSIDYRLPGPNGEPVERITRGQSGSIQELNPVGDSTGYGWSVPTPYLEVHPQYDTVFAFGWGKGVLLTLSVEDPQGQPLANLTTTVGAAPSGDPNVAMGDFSLTGFDLQPGQVLKASGGGITFACLIPDPKITHFEVITDAIRGTATPGTQVVVTARAPGQRISRWVTVDQAGNWMVSFGPSSKPSDSPGVFDLLPGSRGVVLEINKDWDKTWGDDWTIGYPSSGSAAGEGEFSFPAGASRINPDFTGPASFEFEASYGKAPSLPRGSVQFSFKGFSFASTALDWLAIEGDRIQLTGAGKVSGKGSYGFMINAVAGNLSNPNGEDLFRIRIWNKETGEVIFDNQPGSADAIRPITLVKNGKIIIIKKPD